jgi:hypothetical protein
MERFQQREIGPWDWMPITGHKSKRSSVTAIYFLPVSDDSYFIYLLSIENGSFSAAGSNKDPSTA